MLNFRSTLFVAFVLATACVGSVARVAHADTALAYSPRALQEAMESEDSFSLADAHRNDGLGLNSSFFSRNTGFDMAPLTYDDATDHNLAFEDQRVYALLIDGHYDFNYDQTDTMALHPYVMGGMGVARYGQSYASGNSSLTENGDMIPLFRVGGGVIYRLGEQWNLSLDYKAGFSSASDQIFTVRNQQSVDLQTLNMGMHYRF